MMLRAFVIIHTFILTVTGSQCIYYNTTIDKPQNTHIPTDKESNAGKSYKAGTDGAVSCTTVVVKGQ